MRAQRLELWLCVCVVWLAGRSSSGASVPASSTPDPFGPPSDICELTEPELAGLVSALQTATKALAAPPEGTASASGCGQSVAAIKAHAAYIVEQVKFLKQATGIDADMYENLKASVEANIREFREKTDDLQRSHRQDKTNMTHILATTNQMFQQKVNQLMLENQRLNSSYVEKTAKLSASHIRNMEYELAKAEFLKLNNDSLLVGIVTDAYARNPLHIKKIVEFVKSLPNCEQAAIAYAALFNATKANGHGTSPQVVILAHAFETVCNFSSDLQYAAQLPFGRELRSLAKNILNVWATQFRSHSNITDIRRFSNDNGDVFEFYANDLVKSIYNKELKNFEKVFEFVMALYHPYHPLYFEQSLTAYITLYQVMKANGHLDSSELVLFAYRVSRAELSPRPWPQGAQDQFNTLKAHFPSGVRALIWDKQVVIESARHSGYTLYGSAPGNIYIYPSHNYEGGENQKWDVFLGPHINNNDPGRYFEFGNRQNGLKLCGASRGHTYGTEDQYLVGAWKVRCLWAVIPVSKGEMFYFQNEQYAKVLEAGALESCASSRLCCCSSVGVSGKYTGAKSQMWKISQV